MTASTATLPKHERASLGQIHPIANRRYANEAAMLADTTPLDPDDTSMICEVGTSTGGVRLFAITKIVDTIPTEWIEITNSNASGFEFAGVESDSDHILEGTKNWINKLSLPVSTAVQAALDLKLSVSGFTESAIKTLLGITTLSGSNTGDQDLSGYELLSHKANSTLNNSSTEYPTSALVKEVTDNLFNIASGKNSAYTFATLTALNTWLATPANVAALQVGDNLYILDLSTPDYWWDGTQKQELEVSAPTLSDYVPTTRLINGKPLSANVDLVPADISGFNAAALAAAPAESAASTSVAGVVALADDSTATTGTNTAKAVTPAALAAKLGDWLTNTLTSTFATLAGATFSGAVIFGDQTISRGNQKDMGLVVFDKGTISSTSTVTFDHTQGHKQTLTCGGAYTITWAFSNWPPTTNLGFFIVKVSNMGLGTLAFSSTINWKKKDDTFTTTFSTYLTDRGGETALKSSGFDEFMFWSEDAGTTVYGALL